MLFFERCLSAGDNLKVRINTSLDDIKYDCLYNSSISMNSYNFSAYCKIISCSDNNIILGFTSKDKNINLVITLRGIMRKSLDSFLSEVDDNNFINFWDDARAVLFNVNKNDLK